MIPDKRHTPSGLTSPLRDEPGGRLRRAAPSWCLRHVQLGVALGLGLGLVGQTLVWALASGEHDATLGLRVGAVAYTTALWFALAVLLSALSSLWLSTRVGRLAALLLSTGVLGGMALIEAMGIALRLLTGTYLTTGAVMFSLNSSEHFLHAAAGDYRGWVAGIVLLLVGFGALVWRLLAPSARAGQRPPARLVIGGLLMTALLAGVYVQRGESRFTRRMFVAGPLVALVGSFDSGHDFELERTTMRPDQIGAPLAPPGPPLSAGPAWDKAIAEAQGPRPNVLILMLESIAPKHLGYVGYARDTTPNLDRLARQGLNMTHAWTTATHSNYAQMAILSSLFPRRGHGLDQYTRLDYPRVLPHDIFHRLGYVTATISSQDENWQGMLRFQTTGTPTYLWFSEDYRGPHLDTGTEKIAPDEATVDVVLEWLSRTPLDAPWSLYVNFQATHFPYLIPAGAERPWQPSDPDPSTFTYLRYPESEKNIVINRYDNALRYVDAQVGRILAFLEETGELEGTLIVVTADHGETFFDKGLVTHGKTLYEVESRVPLVLHWPERIRPETRSEPVSNLDVMPTVLDLLGLPPHPSFQGTSVARPDPDAVGKRAIMMNIQGLRFADAIVCWPYKLILDRTTKTQMLFDLAADPDEEHNLLHDEPERVRRLFDTLNLQLIAQLDYHAEKAPHRRERYQPRLRPCPDLN